MLLALRRDLAAEQVVSDIDEPGCAFA